MPDKRKKGEGRRGWLYWPKSLKDKFFSCFHLYPYSLSFYFSMLLLLSFYSYSTDDDTSTVDDVDDDESYIHDIHIKSSEW